MPLVGYKCRKCYRRLRFLEGLTAALSLSSKMASSSIIVLVLNLYALSCSFHVGCLCLRMGPVTHGRDTSLTHLPLSSYILDSHKVTSLNFMHSSYFVDSAINIQHPRILILRTEFVGRLRLIHHRLPHLGISTALSFSLNFD